MINTYPEKMPEPVQKILADAHKYNMKLRIFYGDLKTGAAWPEEHDVMGTIGCSTGPQKVPLIIASSQTVGGSPVMYPVVAICSHTHWLYKHPTFTFGKWMYKADDDGKIWVYFNGEKHASFVNIRKATNYISFMQGDRWMK